MKRVRLGINARRSNLATSPAVRKNFGTKRRGKGMTSRPLAGRAVLLCLVVTIGGCRGKAPYEGKNAAELEAMLHSDDPAAQAQGAFGLSRLGAEARPAVPALVASLKGKETLVRQRAAL